MSRLRNANKALKKIRERYGEKFSINDQKEICVGPIDVHIVVDGTTYKLGPYEIRCQKNVARYRKSAIKIYNINKYNSLNHPHISVYGSICFGNVRKLISSLHKNGDLDEVIDISVKFLNSYTDTNPYHRIDVFKTLYCKNCGEHTDDCNCGS